MERVGGSARNPRAGWHVPFVHRLSLEAAHGTVRVRIGVGFSVTIIVRVCVRISVAARACVGVGWRCSAC